MNPTSDNDRPPLPLGANQKIDSVCIDYEDCWMQGSPPSVEHYVDCVEPAARPALVYELLRIDLAFGHMRRELLTEQAYHLRLPEFRDVVRAVFARKPDPSAIRRYEAGESLGRFVIERELGRGAFGAVFLACDRRVNRMVAVKTIRPDLIASDEDRERLLAEASMAGKLSHPSIATLYGVEEDQDGQPLLVYQYIEGASFRDRLKFGLSIDDLTRVLQEIAEAIQHAHSMGVCHRDLQPNNVVQNIDGAAVVTDFGLASHTQLRPPVPGEVAGSPSYLAPEQTRGDAAQIDPRVDIWAMGVMLYEGLTGVRPFVGATPEALFESIQKLAPTPPRQLRASIPLRLEEICLKCLQKSPQDRYSTAADLASELAKFRNRAPAVRRRTMILTALGGVAALAGYLKWEAGDGSPLTAKIQPMVLRDGFWAEVGSARAPHVLHGDSIKLQIEMNQYAHSVIVWVDGDGEATQLYPSPDRWAKKGPLRRKEIRLPNSIDTFWEMEVPRKATESIVLVADRMPLDADQVVKAFEKLPAQPIIPDSGVVRFANGQVQLAAARKRHPQFAEAKHAKHGVLLAQQRIFNQLHEQASLIQSCCFSVLTSHEVDAGNEAI